MAITSLALINPGAETGDLSGWTLRSGVAMANGTSAPAPHSGARRFGMVDSFSDFSVWDQQVAVPAGYHAAIDAGLAAVRAAGWLHADDFDTGALYIECRDAGLVLLATFALGQQLAAGWIKQEKYAALPANTRFLRIGTSNVKNQGNRFNTYWDDFELDVSDDGDADWPGPLAPKSHQMGAYAYGLAETASGEHDVQAQQLGAIAWATQPAQDVKEHQGGVIAFAGSEAASGLFQVKTHQVAAYAWVKGFPDRRDLRAWHFVQDDHPFTVFQLGDSMTLVHDRLTQQWAQWRSSGLSYWRGDDGCAWEGFNVCCDRRSGRIFKIDPTGRLDFNSTTELNDTPIVSLVTGMARGNRMRGLVSCYMAELVVSEGDPPPGFTDGQVGIQLRTSDDDGRTWLDHGIIPGGGLDVDVSIRWYGLGLMKSPGRVFEITDSGYARRIDALDVETG